ncbi:putative Pentatricopeptide repeat-containing protein [Melia azedarach]|uniref:Pentatricopeptide repeat-containing protein n=1 Tax=Melia azedarach TaxID=155640 RepID=A0ACC1X7K3_MELAZ|nr:putative Pentatricopeptide repeat-containing protein [Melia azedarach]
MLQILSTLKNSHKLYKIKQVRSLFSRQQHIFLGDTALTDSPISSLSLLKEPRNEPQVDLSSVNFSGIAKSVLLRCSQLFEVKQCKSHANASSKDFILVLSDVIPETVRKFWRFLVLKPENVLEILLGFQFEYEKVGFRGGKIETVWEMFKWASRQYKGFKHLPRSYEVMASLLVRVGMFREVELLFLAMEREGILLNSTEILSNLIEGYVGVEDIERSILLFNQMRGRGLVPSSSCYGVIIDYLVKMKRTQLAFRICLDMVGMGINLTDVEKASFQNVVRLLCREGKIQESRNLVRKANPFGLEPSVLVLNEIAFGYCEKKDFEDLLSFFAEMKCAPDVLAGNRIVSIICKIYGVERADFFRQALEHLGFRPDEITFGILIGWSCREGNLRSAFLYLSEILSRGLNPDTFSYNSLISGMFKQGMWKHAKDILDEMVNRGTPPTLSTYRILLAGYCKARQIDEAKMMVSEMANCGFIELSLLEDPLSKAFVVLGLNPSAVRLRRDNEMGFSKAEFFDNLGNGLYLDTDLDEFEKKVTEILEDATIPDFNSLVMMECIHGNLKAALLLVDEMVRWGQELSLSVLSALVKGLCASRFHIKACIGLLEKMPKLIDQLDQESLNLLVQSCCKKGLVSKGKKIFDGMLQRGLAIENKTYTALLIGLCKKGILKDLHGYWDIAQNKKWLPCFDDSKALVECLCHKKMLKESLELLESMLVSQPLLNARHLPHVPGKALCYGFFQLCACIGGRTFTAGLQLGSNGLQPYYKRNMAPCWDVSVSLILQLIRADRLEKAVALREISLKEQPLLSSSFHGAFIKGFCMTGKVEEASKLFRDAFSTRMLPEDEVCNTLIQGHCQAYNLMKVKELLGVMIRKNLTISISSYRNLVRWMCMEGRIPCALSLKELMLGQSMSHNSIILNILVFYLISSGNNILVSKVLNELLEDESLLNEVTYNFLVRGFLKHKDITSSVHYLSTMISKGITPSNCSSSKVISCLCEVGELGKALELSQEMRLKGWVHSSIVQNAIVEGLLSCSKLQEAAHFLDQIVGKGLVPDTINYDNLIKQFCRYGRLNKAVELLNIMLKKGGIPNSASYDSIICGLCTCNKLDEAMDFHAEMLARNLKPSMKTWDMLVHKLCLEGRTTEAEMLLMSIVHLGESPTREMYSTVVNRYHFENNLRKASELVQVMQRSWV